MNNTQISKELAIGLVLIGLVSAAMSSLGAPLVPTVVKVVHVRLEIAQWTLTISLLVGAVMTPVLARLGDGPYRRRVILTTLWIVLAGSVLATLPLGFIGLLVGRALQGVGLGLPALIIGVAKDHFVGSKAQQIVALVSVTSLAGVGFGYPIAGAVAEFGGLRAAYGIGIVMAGIALVFAYRTLPHERHRAARQLDTVGAGVFGLALALFLYALTQVAGSTLSSGAVIGISIVALALLVGWVWYERRQSEPLVHLSTLRHPAVRLADGLVLLASIGMYLLLATAVRYVQTPAAVVYGLGASVLTTGCMLTPFSILGFAASRTVPVLRRTMPDRQVLALSAGVVLVSLIGFAAYRNQLWEVFVWIGLAGFGIGGVYATAPALIINAVPAHITTSAIGFNQVLRMVGFSIGSALSALILELYTPRGSVSPLDKGYTAVAIAGIVIITYAIGMTMVSYVRQLRYTPASIGELQAVEENAA